MADYLILFTLHLYKYSLKFTVLLLQLCVCVGGGEVGVLLFFITVDLEVRLLRKISDLAAN